jgi:hypothetical protein
MRGGKPLIEPLVTRTPIAKGSVCDLARSVPSPRPAERVLTFPDGVSQAPGLRRDLSGFRSRGDRSVVQENRDLSPRLHTRNLTPPPGLDRPPGSRSLTPRLRHAAHPLATPIRLDASEIPCRCVRDTHLRALRSFRRAPEAPTDAPETMFRALEAFAPAPPNLPQRIGGPRVRERRLEDRTGRPSGTRRKRLRAPISDQVDSEMSH